MPVHGGAAIIRADVFAMRDREKCSHEVRSTRNTIISTPAIQASLYLPNHHSQH